MKKFNMANVTRAINKAGFKLKKHSPEILIVAGVGLYGNMEQVRGNGFGLLIRLKHRNKVYGQLRKMQRKYRFVSHQFPKPIK